VIVPLIFLFAAIGLFLFMSNGSLTAKDSITYQQICKDDEEKCYNNEILLNSLIQKSSEDKPLSAVIVEKGSEENEESPFLAVVEGETKPKVNNITNLSGRGYGSTGGGGGGGGGGNGNHEEHQPVCGDGNPEGSEQCDDSNSNNNDACKNDCTLNVCGDGYINVGVEECDDNNNVDGDGCSKNCKIENHGVDGECKELGFDFGVAKWECDSEEVEEGSAFDDYTITLDWNKVEEECNSADWTSSPAVDGILSKEATETYVHDGGTSGTIEKNDQHSISHITFCGNECEHDVGIRFSYENSYGTGIAIKPKDGNWISDNPAELSKGTIYIIKYYIDNKIKNSTNYIHVVVKINDTTIADYNKSIENYHYKEIEINISDFEPGTYTISVYVEKVNETDCNMTNNYAERQILILEYCGDEIVEGNEECDDGKDGDDTDGCTDQCTKTFCGDFVVQAPNGYGESEECDDGNKVNGDGCDENCKNELCYGVVVPPPDQCKSYYCDPSDGQIKEDYSDYPLSTPCDNDVDKCTIDHCNGEGACVNYDNVEVPEDDQCVSYYCDPADGQVKEDYSDYPLSTPCEADGDECTIDHCNGAGSCVLDYNDPYCGFCGDEIVQPELNEECESDGKWGSGHQFTCNKDNTYNKCVDCQYEHINTCKYFCSADIECNELAPNTQFETCTDYGYSYLQDYCDNNCQLKDNYCESSYDGCTADPECDEENPFAPLNPHCTNQCTYELQICGNGIIEDTEECDDGDDNGVACDPLYDDSCTYCSNTCEEITLEGGYCGDDNVDQGYEECDDGNNYDNDGCDANCIREYCGDNTINNINEECDDGANNGQECTPPEGGSCTYCLDTCKEKTLIAGVCGDGVINPGEECESDGKWGKEHEFACNKDNTYNKCVDCKYERVNTCKYFCSGDIECNGKEPNTILETCGYGYDYLGDYCDNNCHVKDDKCEYDYNGCTADPECDGENPFSPLNPYCTSQCSYEPVCANAEIECI